MPGRRAVLRGGGALLGIGSVAAVGSFAGVSSFGTEGDPEANPDATGSADVDENSDPASVLVAGSLQQVATRVGDARVEAHGSVACRRLLRDGLRDPDAVALADSRLFEGVAERVTCFATNALVVAVEESLAGEHDDWRALLADPDLALGRTDPERDPLGYRTVMALELADQLDAESVLDRTTVHPETGLLRTLEAGGIDAAFAYRNMAVEHGLPYVSLPDRFDFSTPELADEYAAVAFDLDEETVVGSPIRYAASARTERGRQWIRKLASSGDTLRDAGFGVPPSYPEEREVRSS